MKIIILGGFLGSGKTTALLSLARFLVTASTTDSATKVAILENEIGEVGIDDKMLATSGFSVSNLFAGCACCTVAGELHNAAKRLRTELAPEWLIVEATGLAFPGTMRDNLAESLGITARIIVLADAKRWTRLVNAMEHLLSAQLAGADAVLINKCDLSDAESLTAIEKQIELYAPQATTLRVSALLGIEDKAWQIATGIGG